MTFNFGLFTRNLAFLSHYKQHFKFFKYLASTVQCTLYNLRKSNFGLIGLAGAFFLLAALVHIEGLF